jgi:hypothetical protein
LQSGANILVTYFRETAIKKKNFWLWAAWAAHVRIVKIRLRIISAGLRVLLVTSVSSVEDTDVLSATIKSGFEVDKGG